MKKQFSKSWNTSKQPRKQRKYIANAPLHVKRSMIVSRLSKELSKKYGRRNITLKRGDKVKIFRGNFKSHTGKVERVLTKAMRVYVEGAQLTKRDGNKSYYPMYASNLIITELNLEDKRRQQSLGKNKKTVIVETKNE